MDLAVSVCMASYNGEKYIEEQINSILPQLGDNDEIVISDDGSTDNTRSIIKNLMEKENRIKLIDGPKQDFASNFFNAIRNASNEIIILSDQDDIWADNKVKKILNVFESDPKCTTVLHEMYTFENDINEKGELYPIKYRKGFNINVLFSSYWGCCMAFRKSFIEQFLDVKGSFLSHDQLIGLASERNGKTVFIPEKLLYHRVHGDNRTAHKNSVVDQIKFRLQVFSEYQELEDSYFKRKENKCPEFIKKLADSPLSKISEILMLVFIADCCIFGGGRLVAAGFLSFRIAVFMLAFVTSLPLVLKNFERLFRNPFVRRAILFGICVAIWAVIGFRNENDVLFIKGDITRYLSFALIPGFLVTFNTRKEFDKLVDVIFYSSVFLALIVTVCHFILPFQSKDFLENLSIFVTDYQLGGCSMMESGDVRLFLRSEIFTQVAIMLCVWKVWHAETKPKKIFTIICGGMLLFTWLISYTRGFWFGLAIACLFVLIWQYNIFWKCAAVAMKVLLVACILVGISTAVYREPRIIEEASKRFIQIVLPGGSGEEVDINSPEYKGMVLRIKTKEMHREYIKESPVIGKGLGTQLVGLREEGVTEYSYLDSLMKFGIIGSIFFYGAYLCFVPRCITNIVYKPKENVEDSYYSLITLLVAGYVSVLATSYSNPFIISPLGISLLLVVTTGVFYTWKFVKED